MSQMTFICLQLELTQLPQLPTLLVGKQLLSLLVSFALIAAGI